jgi:hypothetical protein
MKKILFALLCLSMVTLNTHARKKKHVSTKRPKLGYNVFTTHHCKTLRRRRPRPFILVLVDGEPLIDSIQQCMHDARLKSAVISGTVGTLEKVTISYYDRDEKKKYLDRYFKGPFELLTLNGNVTWINNHVNPRVHVHTTLGQRNYSLIGGHLKKATVAMSTEILITPFSTQFIRYPVKDHDELFFIQGER